MAPVDESTDAFRVVGQGFDAATTGWTLSWWLPNRLPLPVMVGSDVDLSGLVARSGRHGEVELRPG